MSNTKTQLNWDTEAKRKYEEMIRKIPLFHREIAKQVVDKQAVINAQERGASQVEESDVVRAFLSEVPNTFFSLMIRLFEEVGFEYKEHLPK